MLPAPRRFRYNPTMLRHLRHRQSLLSGLCVALLALAVAALAVVFNPQKLALPRFVWLYVASSGR